MTNVKIFNNGVAKIYFLVVEDDEKALAEEVRSALRRKHIYIYSNIQEDLQMVRNNYERWKAKR